MLKLLSRLRAFITCAALFWVAGSLQATTQTKVASWNFAEGWDVSNTGTVYTYTPDGSGWQELANVSWKQKQPVFLPNTFSGVQSDYRLSLKTSNGKWQVKQSSSSYVLRLNTASTSRH